MREMTGVCPQYNMQLDMLSVEENLVVFAGIKNIPEHQRKDEVGDYPRAGGLDSISGFSSGVGPDGFTGF